jgi:BirA family transcriptional regulator, biotin operon repressor / biotin---[acetyl-CoA-carboxylase] ligase
VTAAVEWWEAKPVEFWQASWALPDLEIHDVLPSTNDRARLRAAGGAPAGTLVLAEHQTAGRGRLGREWHAAPGSSLLLSFILRPLPAPVAAPGTAPIRVGLAVARAVDRATGVRCRIKWPNDLLAPDGRKLAGVLCEATSAGDDHLVIVTGVGLNVRDQGYVWPADVRAAATSLEASAGRTVDRPALLGDIVAAVRPLFTAPLLPLGPDELAEFAARDALRDRSVRMDGVDVPVIVRGMDADAALLVEQHGSIRRITNATLRLAAQSRDVSASGADT